MKIAQYQSKYGSIIIVEANKYNEEPSSELIRVSEISEVEFIPLPEDVHLARELQELEKREARMEKELSELKARINKIRPTPENSDAVSLQ